MFGLWSREREDQSDYLGIQFKSNITQNYVQGLLYVNHCCLVWSSQVVGDYCKRFFDSGRFKVHCSFGVYCKIIGVALLC